MDSHERRKHSRIAREVQDVLEGLTGSLKSLDNKLDALREKPSSVEGVPAQNGELGARIGTVEDLLLRLGTSIEQQSAKLDAVGVVGMQIRDAILTLNQESLTPAKQKLDDILTAYKAGLEAIERRTGMDNTERAKMGGEARAKAMTSEERSNAAKKAAQARWRTKREQVPVTKPIVNDETTHRNNMMFEMAKAAHYNFISMDKLVALIEKYPSGLEPTSPTMTLASSAVTNFNKNKKCERIFGGAKLERASWARARGIPVPETEQGWRLVPPSPKDDPYLANKPRLYSLEEVSKRLGMDVKRLANWAIKGLIPSTVIGEMIYLDEATYKKLTAA